jgi:hypothetical protein
LLGSSQICGSLGAAQNYFGDIASLVKITLEGDEYRLSALGGIVTELRFLLMSEFVDARVVLDHVLKLLIPLRRLVVNIPVMI